MKLQQTLEYLELEQLPEAGTSTSQRKCACLVERVTGVKDYAIAKNGGIVADLNFTASIKRIVEFYPVSKKKLEEQLSKFADEMERVYEIDQPVKDAVVESISKSAEILELTQPQQSEVNVAFDKMITKDPQPVSKRELMIAFLETQRNKRASLDLKTDEQLTEMCKRFGKEF